MKVVLTSHARSRLEQPRQHGISIKEVIRAVEKAPPSKDYALRTSRFKAIYTDKEDGRRVIVTVVGFLHGKKEFRKKRKKGF